MDGFERSNGGRLLGGRVLAVVLLGLGLFGILFLGAMLGSGFKLRQECVDQALDTIAGGLLEFVSCFEGQLFDGLVGSPHDVFMDQVVTEGAVYQGRGRHQRG